MSKRTLIRAAALLWTVLIILGAVFRGRTLGKHLQTSGVAHLATHLVVFAILGALLFLSYKRPAFRGYAVSFGLVLGLWTEAYEHLAFGSQMEYADVLSDAAGVLLGAGLALLVQRRR